MRKLSPREGKGSDNKSLDEQRDKTLYPDPDILFSALQVPLEEGELRQKWRV